MFQAEKNPGFNPIESDSGMISGSLGVRESIKSEAGPEKKLTFSILQNNCDDRWSGIIELPFSFSSEDRTLDAMELNIYSSPTFHQELTPPACSTVRMKSVMHAISAEKENLHPRE